MTLRLDGESRLFPIVGDPIVYARSPDWFSHHLAVNGINAVCVPMQVPDGALEPVIRGLTATPNVDGVIVTMPHKTTAIAHCATVSETSRILGAVSAMRRRTDGTWHGHTTDGDAFAKALVDNGAVIDGTSALLLGAGGAGSAIAVALLRANVGTLVIHDLDGQRVEALIERLGDLADDRVLVGTADPTGFDLVCNATPMGMADDDPPPLPLDQLDAAMFVGDVIAGHGQTPLIEAARRAGCGTADGDQMVVAVQDIMLDFLTGPPPGAP